MARLQETIPNLTPEVEPVDSTSITMPSGEEQAEEQQVKGLSRKQHYAQYVQGAAELGEDMLLGEDTAKEQMEKTIEYLCGATHLREAAWHMTGAGLCHLYLTLAGSPAYEVFEVLQQHFLSEVQYVYQLPSQNATTTLLLISFSIVLNSIFTMFLS